MPPTGRHTTEPPCTALDEAAHPRSLPEATTDHRAIDCPVVVAQGTHDVLTLSQAVWLALLVPGARCRVLPFADHSGVGDVRSQVIRLVDRVAAAAGA